MNGHLCRQSFFPAAHKKAVKHALSPLFAPVLCSTIYPTPVTVTDTRKTGATGAKFYTIMTMIPTRPIEVIPLAEAKSFIRRWHYSKIFPPHCLVNLAQRDEAGEIAAVSLWGFGVRPRHTIQRLFPSLDTGDYFELNRLCLRDDLPRNSESHFLSLCADWIRKHKPQIKLLFSWADGLRGKPGYVYQASSWLYGGFIKTELYLDADGGPVHPRLMITRLGTRCRAEWLRQGFTKWWGYQFRYCKFLCGHRQRKKLLKESPFDWASKYPKNSDCRWWRDAGEGSRESRDAPSVEGTGRFRHPALDSTTYSLFTKDEL